MSNDDINSASVQSAALSGPATDATIDIEAAVPNDTKMYLTKVHDEYGVHVEDYRKLLVNLEEASPQNVSVSQHVKNINEAVRYNEKTLQPWIQVPLLCNFGVYSSVGVFVFVRLCAFMRV